MIVDADASLLGAGCVLSQVQDGKERVIAYYSNAFNRQERNYCVTRRELLAIVVALKRFEPYLLFRRFAVRTDHSSLKPIQSVRCRMASRDTSINSRAPPANAES